ARPAVKRKMKKEIPPLLERPVYVGTSGLAMWFVLFYWVPFGPYLYRSEETILFDVPFYLSLGLIIYSTIGLNHSIMFGLRQGYAAWKKTSLPESTLQENGIYGIVRHPLTSLLIVALWSHETLTAGRLMFNVLFTGYALIGTIFEERDLIKHFGEDYRDYARRVPAYLPRLGRG
ncbi:MAG TPA: isoprenylcysteine carboxylmethyltransferase family protein, partial [Acidobacteriota bacterium]|nr:isoprenylcysteine carboxylmethyltransferase family protein [Acidobacteriota bacterium]